MNDDKSVKNESVRLKYPEESMEVFPIENRISSELTEDEVYEQSVVMGLKSVVYNGLVPYRNALAILERRYLEMKDLHLQSGLDMNTEPFIPEYFGFEEFMIKSDIHYYKKGEVVVFPAGNRWRVFNDSMSEPVTFKIDNALQAMNILNGLGADININDYLDAE